MKGHAFCMELGGGKDVNFYAFVWRWLGTTHGDTQIVERKNGI